MLGPSPDWNVGLSAEDLCTAECGWVQRLTKDLLPWDAGTDSGHSYEVSVSISHVQPNFKEKQRLFISSSAAHSYTEFQKAS